MRLAPRYDGPSVLSIDDAPTRQLAPTTGQRVRLRATLATLTDDQWRHPSRCAGWSVRDVVAHLVTVNGFWNASIVAGRSGEPTRVLAGFDPAATPPMLVATMSALSHAEVLERFVESNDALLNTIAGLTDDEWSMPAESPVGHVPIRLVAQHALWDCWIHERDVMLPLGLTATTEPDEVASCLQYAAVVSALLGLAVGHATTGAFSLEAHHPDVQLAVEVADVVTLRTGPFDATRPCLRGDAVELVEVLSLRAPPPADSPREWLALLAGLRAAFDA